MGHTAVEATGFRHEAFVYRTLDGYVSGLANFLRDGVEAGEPAMVAVDRPKIGALQAALGDTPRGRLVEYVDMDDIGGNPARIIPAWRDFIDRHEGRAVRGIGEPVWPERSSAELGECQ